jgi:hypothetical protein
VNINSAFPSKYLKAADAEETDLILTIAKVKLESIGQGSKQEQKPVVYFIEVDKGMVLNKTNANMISNIAKSEDTDDWTGVKIKLIATEVEFQGDLVQSLRVREIKKAKPGAALPKPAAAPAEDNTPDDSEVPF